jgi:hypothetical protein
MWRASIRVPVPAALALVVLLPLGVWGWTSLRSRGARSSVSGVGVEAPDTREWGSVDVVCADQTGPRGLTALYDLRPVAELRPRIMRISHAHD